MLPGVYAETRIKGCQNLGAILTMHGIQKETRLLTAPPSVEEIQAVCRRAYIWAAYLRTAVGIRSGAVRPVGNDN